MYHFIVNPKSQSGHGLHIWHQIEEILKEKEVIYTVLMTRYPSHATELTRQLTQDMTKKIIIVLGGDGTVNEVINGIEHPDTVTLGYIPTGSCNDLARGFNLPLDPLLSLSRILNHQHYIRSVDQGMLTFSNHKAHLFASNAGMGLDAAIAKRASEFKLKKLLNFFHLGKFIYVAALLQELMNYHPVDGELTIDGNVHVIKNIYFIAFNVHPYEGGGMKMNPYANPFDQKVDICLVHNVSKLKILLLFPLIFAGKHLLLKGVKHYQGTHFHIKTQKNLWVHSDGESLGKHTSVSLDTTPHTIKMIL